MILFMPWPVQKYITTHLYIIAEFVEGGKLPYKLRVIPGLLRTSPPHCALIPNCFALLSRFARYSRIAPHSVLSQFCAAFTLRPVGLRVHVASSSQMRYMPRASSRMCALDGILTRKKHPACDMRRQDASKLFYIEFSRISKLNLCLTARITAARMLGMAKLSLEAPSQARQQAFSLCQMLQILCCGST